MAFTKKPVSPYDPNVPVNDYGSPSKGRKQFDYDRAAFAKRWGEDRGCPSRDVLFRRIADSIVPGWFEWHAWTNKIVEGMCERRWLGLAGCSNSAKTRNVSGFAATWWLADPANSSVILCSTTMKMLRKRAWSEIRNYHSALTDAQGEPFGNLVNSQTCWQYDQGDDKHAIFCIAVEEGDVNKNADRIKGIHTKRQMVVIDEATSVSPAIWKACSNLYGYPIDNGGEFVLVAIANPRFRIDQFGRFIEPDGGWDSVSVETDSWETKPQLDGQPALVIRFDFKKSPNITEGKKVSSHLPSKQRVEAKLAALVKSGGENDPNHWSDDRGFPPPDGMANTVLTESMIIKHGGYDLHQFIGTNFQIIAFYDQARTGDRPALRFAAMGDIGHNKVGIEWMEPIILYHDATSKDPIAYQQLAQTRKHCENVKYRGQIYTCHPGNLGIDVSNEAAFADICQREWSPDIIRVQFGSAASEDPASPEDPRPANEVYKNKRAEMFFRTRTCLESGQLKGIDKDSAAELCTLEYTELRSDGTCKPIVIQDKKEYRLKYNKSPDLADCGVGVMEVARIKGFRIVATGHTVKRNSSFDKVVEEAQQVYSDEGYSAENDGQFTEADFV